ETLRICCDTFQTPRRGNDIPAQGNALGTLTHRPGKSARPAQPGCFALSGLEFPSDAGVPYRAAIACASGFTIFGNTTSGSSPRRLPAAGAATRQTTRRDPCPNIAAL